MKGRRVVLQGDAHTRELSPQQPELARRLRTKLDN